MLNKIKEIKSREANLFIMIVRQKLYSIKYTPNKEKAAQLWDRLEKLIREHNNIFRAVEMNETEIRDIFYNPSVHCSQNCRY